MKQYIISVFLFSMVIGICDSHTIICYDYHKCENIDGDEIYSDNLQRFFLANDIPYAKYEALNLQYPIQEEFDPDGWYYSIQYKGYVNATDVWSIFYGSSLLLKKENNKWKIREIMLFD